MCMSLAHTKARNSSSASRCERDFSIAIRRLATLRTHFFWIVRSQIHQQLALENNVVHTLETIQSQFMTRRKKYRARVMCKKGVCVCVCVCACEKERERNKDEIGTPNAIDTFWNYTCAINGIRSRFHISLHTYTTSNFCMDFFFAFFLFSPLLCPLKSDFFFFVEHFQFIYGKCGRWLALTS